MDALLDPEFWARWLSIVVIDLTLAGDNALVIALAVRTLPRKQQWQGRLWGTAGAVALRLGFIVVATFLLRIPFLQLVGGLLLVWIAVKLVRQPTGARPGHVREGSSLREAVWIIVVADAVMSLDNVLAVAAAAHGDLLLVVFGIALSLPLVADGHAAHGAGRPLPLGPRSDVVAERREAVARLTRQPTLRLDLARRHHVRPERVGEAAGGDPRHLDRLLDRHAEHGHVEEHLEHRLLLDVATRSAERQRPAVLEGDGRRGCETRALARRHDAGMAAVEPTLRATRRHDASDTGHDRRVGVRIARRRRERVPRAVNDGHVARVE